MMRLTKSLLAAFFLALVQPPIHAQVVIAPADRLPVRIQGKQLAPEFEDIAEWIHSKPLTIKEMRGKVVVVHFMAFG
jgi:hypothetical protein